MVRRKVETEDGSHSFFVEALDEYYHSIYGAIQEAQHVFIDAGLNYFPKESTLQILEIGFGTGLNAFMTLLENQHRKNNIYYTGVEGFPLSPDETKDLNYAEAVNQLDLQFFLMKMHAVQWEVFETIQDGFDLMKVKMDIATFQPQKNSFNIIYFDAFAPTAQPELWTENIFQNMYDCLAYDGILVTYCAKGVVKRTLKKVGFKIEALPGPKRKREMTRAIKML